MQGREGQLHLGLHACDPYQPQVGGCPGRVVQERALAYPGLAPDHHDAAVPSTYLVQEPVEQLTFPPPVEKRQGRTGKRVGATQGQPCRCS
jgi:hypothetical protein